MKNIPILEAQTYLTREQSRIVYSSSLVTAGATQLVDGNSQIVYGCTMNVKATSIEKVALRRVMACVTLINVDQDQWYRIDEIVAVRITGFSVLGTTSTPFANVGDAPTLTTEKNVVHMKLSDLAEELYGLFLSKNASPTISFIIPLGSLPFVPDADNEGIIQVDFTAIMEYM